MTHQASVRRARTQRTTRLTGFVVTWDVNSRDRAQSGRVRRFVYGDKTHVDGKLYTYPGFVHREGVRYLGQSVLFVTKGHLEALCGFLRSNGLVPVVTEAWLGRILRL
ncbi:MAG: hypothetical protein E6K18_01360 [Methanobacteriota archaeon]|nr:MAG: hypothetical protein E6K18_01360 [Euryarchaeota archaeon]